MSILDKMRQKQGLVIAAEPVATAEAAPVADPKAERKAAKKAAKDAVPKIKYRCGHEQGIPGIAAGDCWTCRNKARVEKNIRNRGRFEAKREANRDANRLPDGAVYCKTYDASTKTWTVTLAIPGVPVLSAQGSGSFRTETEVDKLYRAWLASENVAEKAESVGA